MDNLLNENENFHNENSEVKNNKVKLPNIFEQLLESLTEELPSKENFPHSINFNVTGNENCGQNFNSAIVKDTSLLLSDLEDQLSAVLARKRYENAHVVNNMSSLTLSYARAFYAHALADLQSETKKSDHKKEWKTISQNFTEAAAERYIDYLALQMSANGGESVQSIDDILGEIDDAEEDQPVLSWGSQLEDKQLAQMNALTPVVKDNMMSFDSTPSFAPCTPTIGIKPKKMKGFKSPLLTPVIVEPSDDRANILEYGKKANKQLGKKRLNFSSSHLNDNSVEFTQNGENNDERNYNKTKQEELKECSTLRRKIVISTLITEKTNCVESGSKKDCSKISETLERESCYGLIDTPLRRTAPTFTSPQSPPCKRLIFSSPKRSYEYNNGLKNLTDANYKVSRMSDVLGCRRMNKRRQSLLNFVRSGSEVFERKRSRSLSSSPLDKCEVNLRITPKINGNSPMPCMPVPIQWAPKKAKKPALRNHITRCRRSLIRQFQLMSVNPQFMDTPPGSPGSFAPLPLMD